MLIFDQLKKNDPQLRVLAVVVFSGLAILFAGLWWVQIVSARDYQANLQTQSYRTVRIPAARGKILDRHGTPLAENRPTYTLNLYLEELRPLADEVYSEHLARLRAARQAEMEAEERRLGRPLTRVEKRRFNVTTRDRNQIRQRARYEVASNIVWQTGARLGQTLILNPDQLKRHYETRLALPYPVLQNLAPEQVARFHEQAGIVGVDIEMQSSRVYPHHTSAAHVVGYLRRDDSSAVGEEASFSYRLPDYRGLVGVEAGCDEHLRGRAGAKSVLVNNMGYRHTENIWSPAEPGNNVTLTLDLPLQQAVERALPVMGPATRGAAVVMDVHSGDLLALASIPAFNPNYFAQGFPPGEIDRLNDPKLRPQINRATQENYAPGSIFKTLIGLAALEAGLNPDAIYTVPPDPQYPHRGCIYIGRRKIIDLAEPGPYDFRRALIRSSNAYFVTNGLRAGMENIVRLAEQFHLGERTGLPTRQEVAGIFPTLKQVRSGWTDGDTANICMGQGRMAVTPLQMTVMIAAIANGGKVLWPRLIHSVEPMEPIPGHPPTVFPSGRVRSQLSVRPEHLRTIRQAMLADVEDPSGTGRAAAVPGLRICGKTGTAQVTDERNHVVDHTTWFAAFAPYEAPRYAVVVMIESGGSGGATCAPIARNIFLALQERERTQSTVAAAATPSP